MKETELYAPVKRFLEAQGYEVKAEVQGCDVLACRGDDPPVIVELKLSLSLSLLLQGVERQAISDAVYLAVAAGKGRIWRSRVKGAVRLCRRLGLGLISVRMERDPPQVEVHADPGPYRPRKATKRQTALLREFHRRTGDGNQGGQTRRKVMTAYRQDALRLALALAQDGEGKPAALAASEGVSNAASILQKDHYGWFDRVSRGVYRLNDAGRAALKTYGDVVDLLKK